MAVAHAQWVASTLAMLTPKFAFALHHSDTLPIAFAFLRLCVLVFAFAMALARLLGSGKSCTQALTSLKSELTNS